MHGVGVAFTLRVCVAFALLSFSCALGVRIRSGVFDRTMSCRLDGAALAWWNMVDE